MQYAIVVAHDLGPVGDAALEFAADLAAHCGGTLHVVYVAPVMPGVTAPRGDSPLASPSDVELAARRLHDAVRRRGLDAQTEVVEARDVAAAIVAVAGRHRARLVVVGTHGRSGLRRSLLGSVAEAVVRTANCPVVTVRAGVRTGP